MWLGVCLKSTASKLEPRSRYQHLLQPVAPNPQPIECLCIRCGEDTRLKDGSKPYVDNHPIWTLGLKRPLYLERKPVCFNCQDQGHSAGRFIPKDPTIPSIYLTLLRGLADSFSASNETVIAMLMDHWPPSTRGVQGCLTWTQQG